MERELTTIFFFVSKALKITREVKNPILLPSDVPEFYALIFAVADDMSSGD